MKYPLTAGPRRPAQGAPRVYGEKDVLIRYLCLDLRGRPIRRLARFVLVEHPDRGRIVFLCTDLSLNPIEIIRRYGPRFKIEFSFKPAVRTLGAYGYHFWMRTMDKTGSRSGDQYRHRKTNQYRDAIRRKLAAYHRFIQIALIASGPGDLLRKLMRDRLDLTRAEGFRLAG